MSPLHTWACPFAFLNFFFLNFLIVEASKPISERAKVHTSHWQQQECRSTVSCRDDRLLETPWKARSCSCTPALYWSDRDGAVLLPEQCRDASTGWAMAVLACYTAVRLRRGEKVIPSLNTLKFWLLVLSLKYWKPTNWTKRFREKKKKKKRKK